MGGVTRNVNGANWPAVWPQLYQTTLTSGPRYTIMRPSPIPRIYHHTAGLTRDGTILVAGCDACSRRHHNQTMPTGFYSGATSRVRVGRVQ